MLLILDSNEYIFALGAVRECKSERLLEKVLELSEVISIRIPRLIVEEVRGNLTPEAFKEFILLITSLTKIDENIEVPFELGARYEGEGLKLSLIHISEPTRPY